MATERLGSFLATGQHDHGPGVVAGIDQPPVRGQADATGTGDRQLRLDRGQSHLQFGAAQQVDEGHRLQAFRAVGNGDEDTAGLCAFHGHSGNRGIRRSLALCLPPMQPGRRKGGAVGSRKRDGNR